ncbi:hypothetical protein BDZ91DRAFT_789986 [Kalaharituber pfeilii]|nr:hypothetical protein BDZ91DRAFT_789986 [Kalaharituber pfeilii]
MSAYLLCAHKIMTAVLTAYLKNSKDESYGLNPRAMKNPTAGLFMHGFLIWVASRPEQFGRNRYRCVRYGDTPRSRHGLTATAVTQKEYKAIGGIMEDRSGKKRRQWQVLVVLVPRLWYCKWEVYQSLKNAEKLHDGIIRKDWLLGVNECDHARGIAENPFDIPSISYLTKAMKGSL